MRIINTGLNATEKYKDVFKSIFGQMSDGIWENSPKMNGYWVCADMEVNKEDNTIVIEIEENPYYAEWGKTVKNPYYSMSDAKVLAYLANKIKQIVAEERKYFGVGYAFNLDNETVPTFLERGSGLTIGDAYGVYAYLMQRAKDIS